MTDRSRPARRNSWLVSLLGVALLSTAAWAQALTPKSFHAKASLKVDATERLLSYAIAMIEPRPAAPGYSWIRVDFYSFAPTTADVAEIAKGNAKTMDHAIYSKANYPTYNTNHGGLLFTVDQDRHLAQVDMSVPGFACTIAPTTKTVETLYKHFTFDGKRIKLKNNGSFDCEMGVGHGETHHFAWDVDLDVPVFERQR